MKQVEDIDFSGNNTAVTEGVLGSLNNLTSSDEQIRSGNLNATLEVLNVLARERSAAENTAMYAVSETEVKVKHSYFIILFQISVFKWPNSTGNLLYILHMGQCNHLSTKAPCITTCTINNTTNPDVVHT